jgi:hypothetical protein
MILETQKFENTYESAAHAALKITTRLFRLQTRGVNLAGVRMERIRAPKMKGEPATITFRVDDELVVARVTDRAISFFGERRAVNRALVAADVGVK